MTTTETPRSEYGSPEQQSVGPLSLVECQQIVDDILEALKNPNSLAFNSSLAAELQIWTELKNRQADPIANAIVDMVRCGDKPLHRFFTPSVQVFIGKVDLTSHQQQGRNGGGTQGYGRPPSGSPQGQYASRYRQ